MGEYRACCGLRYRLCGLYWARDTRGDEHESSTDESWAFGPGDQPARQGVLFPALLELSACDYLNEDFVCGVFRAVRRAGCVERVPWILVHLRVPILDFILVDYPYQVGHLSEKSG
jgi:hypothetical protein